MACTIIAPIRAALIGPLFKQSKLSLPALSVLTQSRWCSGSGGAEIVRVEGHDAYYEALHQQIEEEKKNIFALFTASKIAGRAWCTDSTLAAPVIEESMKKLPKGSVLIRCGVGQRDEWKNPNNVFRNDPNLRLTCIPTLIKVNSQKRLLERQCADKNLVEMFFEEE